MAAVCAAAAPTAQAAVLGGSPAPGHGSGVALRVIPFPGTPDAAPASQVIFSALRPAELRSVTVVGSRSGPHKGRLEVLPTGAGTAFAPSDPFAPGETVVVTAALSSPQAGTVSGDPGASRLRFSFGVATPVRPIGLTTGRQTGLQPQAWMSKTGDGPTQSFVSEPNLQPPLATVTQDPDTTSGDIFITPQNSPQVGPMIMSGSGRLVWFDPVAHGVSTTTTGNFAVQRYLGKPVLTWWKGTIAAGVVKNPSADVIMDRSYRTVATVHAGYGDVTDLHEFQLTPQGTAYLDTVSFTTANLTSVGGPANGPVSDYTIQEIDVKTGKVLWEWHALGHVPISASYQPYSSAAPYYDYFHLNSIQQLPNGNLVVSARDTCAVYEISRKTGQIIWTLGGKYSNFLMGTGTTFWWQHDARLRGNTLSLFDDAALPQKESQSSAKYLNINFLTRMVSLTKRFTHSPPVLASAGGSTETLPNGNVFVGWGTSSQFSEFTPSGQMILNGSFAFRVVSYRAFRFPWVGEPDDPPSVAVVPRAHGHVTTYASWNGSTEVASWRVMGGSTRDQLRPLAAGAPVSGFETTVDVPSEPRYFAVQALDSNGKVLGTSQAQVDPQHLAVFGSRVFVSSSGGSAAVPVGCLARRSCGVTVKLESRGSVIGQSTTPVVPAERAALLPVTLGAAGQHELMAAPGHRLAVQVIASSSSVPVAKTDVTLISYSSTGTVNATSAGFVSPGGQAEILSTCYAPVPCHIKETLTASGQVIGQTSAPVPLGANEAAYIGLQLTAAGRRMLARAPGNALPAESAVTTDGKLRTRKIDLVAYG
jgi:Arylsulfotransferase (ASST)